MSYEEMMEEVERLLKSGDKDKAETMAKMALRQKRKDEDK